MAKQTRKKDPQQKAQRKLEKAQQDLELAQEKYGQARAEADKLIAKATKRLERRAQAVADAEAELLSLSEPTTEPLLQTINALGDGESVEEPSEALVTATTVIETDFLRERERVALSALLELDRDEGVSAAEWRSASGQTETTLSRARDILANRGLITREGPTGRGARYRVTEAGRSALLASQG